jgi:uncharacterized protein (DUF433 family)
MKEYVEKRGSGLFVTGTRVAIEAIVCEYKKGASPESILLAYPGAGSLENVYGAIAWYLTNQGEAESYLEATSKLWEKMRSQQRLPQALQERLERARAAFCDRVKRFRPGGAGCQPLLSKLAFSAMRRYCSQRT